MASKNRKTSMSRTDTVKTITGTRDGRMIWRIMRQPPAPSMLRCLDLCLVQRLQGSVEHQHDERRKDPGVGEHDANPRPNGIAEPIRRIDVEGHQRWRRSGPSSDVRIHFKNSVAATGVMMCGRKRRIMNRRVLNGELIERERENKTEPEFDGDGSQSDNRPWSRSECQKRASLS